ncbi:hypothetical protein [Deinococcus sp. SL84]|uniref:hypothetical protein n=1 Tax=Deinococcus sp. SL84 TaxID=2994663 RepID=UPI002272D889|nr:hypothetical protein [Deinococcus sp. SL84]MCY1703689.1 hypothetical protein [Deinococcus sp. SL84]
MKAMSCLLILVASLGIVAAVQNAYKADSMWPMLGHGAFTLLCLLFVVREVLALSGR